jgi:hypothetical protein
MTDSNERLSAQVTGAEHREVAGVHIDMTRVGDARVRRVIYPVGFRWTTHMKPLVGTDRCMHAHVGFIVGGAIEVEYADGCRETFAAPQAVSIAPGHEGWVVGNEPAVMIEVDFEGDTAQRFGVRDHKH